MENTTRISDLPQKAQAFSNETNTLKQSDNTTNYTPLNIHPNPYGISEKNPIMPNPEFEEPLTKKEINQEIENIPHQAMPSRDIPNDTNIYTQDPSITPNYIPPSHTKDFLPDFEEYENELLLQEKEDEKKDNFDFTMSRIQIPLLLAVLFYFFNTHFIRNLLLKFIPMDLIYSDGNLNKLGTSYLSICFGISYFLIDYIINFLGNM